MGVKSELNPVCIFQFYVHARKSDLTHFLYVLGGGLCGAANPLPGGGVRVGGDRAGGVAEGGGLRAACIGLEPEISSRAGAAGRGGDGVGGAGAPLGVLLSLRAGGAAGD